MAQKVPPRIAEAIARYADYGLLPGATLRALIRGDEAEARAIADGDVIANWHAVTDLITERIPDVARGSEAAMDNWAAQRGREGV